MTDFDDQYSTCEATHVTLSLRSSRFTAHEISKRFGLDFTAFGPSTAGGTTWSLSSEGQVDSRDLRRHLDWLADRVLPRVDNLQALREAGVEANVTCYWVSAHGHGGPTISPAQLRALAQLNLDFWFDFYSADEGD